jgi:hypothetical protein
MPTFSSEMISTGNIDLKRKLTQLLLRVVLLFTIFTISGYADNHQMGQRQRVRTELVISGNYKVSIGTISYKKAFKPIRFYNLFISRYKSWNNTLFTYDVLTQVKLKSIARQFCFHRPSIRFLLVKTIPKNSDEDTFVNLG